MAYKNHLVVIHLKLFLLIPAMLSAKSTVEYWKCYSSHWNTSECEEHIYLHPMHQQPTGKMWFEGCFTQEKSLVEKRHKRGKLYRVIEKKDWAVDSWKRAAWSENTKIKMPQQHWKKWALKMKEKRLVNEEVQKAKEFVRESVTEWWCMAWKRPKYACHIKDSIDGDVSVHVWENKLQKSLNYYSKCSKILYFSRNDKSTESYKMDLRDQEDTDFVERGQKCDIH